MFVALEKFKLKRRLSLLVWSVLLAVGLTTSSAQSATVTFGLVTEFSGGTAPAGTAPWVTATLDDSFGGANTVRLTMSAGNLTGGQSGESLTQFYLNFDPLLDSSNLTFQMVGLPIDQDSSVSEVMPHSI